MHETLKCIVLMPNRVRLLEHYLVEVDIVCVYTRAARDQCYLKTFSASKQKREMIVRAVQAWFM